MSTSFNKELMRRSTQFHLEGTDTSDLEIEDVEAALDELPNLACYGTPAASLSRIGATISG